MSWRGERPRPVRNRGSARFRPEAEFFAQVFCRVCGSPMPRVDARGFAIIPMGSFDDDPGTKPMRHIFVGSKAPWFPIADNLPQFAERPTEV